MNDLLPSVRAPAIPDGASDSGGVPLWAGFGPSAARGATGLSQQMGAGNPPPPDDDGSESGGGVLDGFFAQVASIKELLADIRKGRAALAAQHARSQVAMRPEDVKAIHTEMKATIAATNGAALRIRAALDALEADNLAAQRLPGCGQGSSSERARSAVTGALRRKLAALMADFQQLRSRIQAEYREVVQRRVYTVTGEVPGEAQVEDLIERGESEQVFQRAIKSGGRLEIEAVAAEIHERHDAVRDVEAGLAGLQEVFSDMAVLAEGHGEMLDNIEAQVGRAQEHVQGGTNAMVDAKRTQKRTRKLHCCLLVAILLIVGIIVGVVMLILGVSGTFN